MFLWLGASIAEPATNNYPLKRGNKLYQLANHLGNVLATISDRKLGIDDVNANGHTPSGSIYYEYIDYYLADVANAQDYYPFGMEMPGRTYANGAFVDGDYRFGFNGQEEDDEVYGEGNSTTAMYWQYDSRLGRRWNIDPVTFASLSGYSTFASNPILYSDLLGDRFRIEAHQCKGSKMFKIRITFQLVILRLFSEKDVRHMVRDIHLDKDHIEVINNMAEVEGGPNSNRNISLYNKRDKYKSFVFPGSQNSHGSINFILANELGILANEIFHRHALYMHRKYLDYDLEGIVWPSGDISLVNYEEKLSQESENQTRR